MTDEQELPPPPFAELTYWERALRYAKLVQDDDEQHLFGDAIEVLVDTVQQLVAYNQSVETINSTVLSTLSGFRAERDAAKLLAAKYRGDLVLLGVLDAE